MRNVSHKKYGFVNAGDMMIDLDGYPEDASFGVRWWFTIMREPKKCDNQDSSRYTNNGRKLEQLLSYLVWKKRYAFIVGVTLKLQATTRLPRQK